jgi:hypothetical protein
MPDLDLGKLRQRELIGLLNGTKIGSIVKHHHKLTTLIDRAGMFRISDGSGNRINFLKFVAAIVEIQNEPKKDPRDYESHKKRTAQRQRELSESARDIANGSWMHDVRNLERKDACRESFQLFCEEYFPQAFHLEWSPDHLKVIAKIEIAVIQGGLFAMAMPRGSGKTTIAEVACIWAALYGYIEFIMLIGSSETHAVEMLESIKTELETNENLYDDFSEVVGPIRALEGITHRAGGQTLNGTSTHIGWTANEVIIPTVPDSVASGCVIRVAGITGRIRGANYKKPSGRSVRPGLVILDDPQTDESAKSISQCEKRERLIAGAVLGLAGPGEKISGILPCTVIRPDDMADRLLNRELHPEWQGERTKLVYSFPVNEKLWDKYAEIREDSLRQEKGLSLATAYYAENREAMDEGARTAWDERFNHDELSAIQHAMNLKFQDVRAFWAEYQNEPLPESELGSDELTPDDIAQKLNGYDRSVVPPGCDRLTAFVDVQGKLLYFVVVAWETDFTGYVIEYGSYPDQQSPYYTLRDARRTLATQARGAGLEGSIYAGLEALIGDLMGREFLGGAGSVMRIERCMIDANWGASTDTVYQFCRQSDSAAVLFPSHGQYVGAASLSFADYKRKKGDRVGHHWRIPSVAGRRAVRHVLYDTNYWKTFVHTRFGVQMGDRGSLSLFGRTTSAHRMFSEHLTSEYRVKTEGRGRVVDEWKARPEQPDNHFLDCLVGCAVAASIQGTSLPKSGSLIELGEKPLKLSEIKRKAYAIANR